MTPQKEPGFSALVVDGSKFQRGLIAGMLRSAGAERVQQEESSDDAVTFIVDRNPELIVIDFDIGPMGAVQFARHIRRTTTFPNRAVPIIVLMGRATKKDVEELREVGVDAILMKPCSPQMIHEKLAVVMAPGRPFIFSAEYVGPCRRKKVDAGYRGPMRRLSDVTVAPEGQEAPEGYKPPSALVEALARLAQAASALVEQDLAGAQQVLSRTLQVRATALDVGDGDVSNGAFELVRYLEAVGASERLSAQAVRIHVEALHQIVAIAPAEKALRLRLSDSLKRLVNKKLMQSGISL
jgi:CheY-like chemotaxis protein